MKLVKYVAGDFDLTCNPKECPAVITSVEEITIKAKGSDESKNIQVANLLIFQDAGELVETRAKVPHADDKLIGRDGKSVHAYFEEYDDDPKIKLLLKHVADLEKTNADALEKIADLSSRVERIERSSGTPTQ